VSMSWGLTEGQTVTQADEALYDTYLTTPAGHQGVTFVASSGDFGSADPEYPSFSPNVVSVGGTSLYLNGDNSYNSETAWGGYSTGLGAYLGSGGGISQYETEPSYQYGVQSTGFRTAPDVSFVADPTTGVWIADPYNLPSSNPWEIVGGTSLSAPAWAGLFAVANEGRTNAGETTLNSDSPTDVQQALYTLPQRDFNQIGGAQYSLATGLGTPVASALVPDLVAYQNTGNNQLTAPAPTAINFAITAGNGPASYFGGSTNAISAYSEFNLFVLSPGEQSMGSRITASSETAVTASVSPLSYGSFGSYRSNESNGSHLPATAGQIAATWSNTAATKYGFATAETRTSIAQNQAVQTAEVLQLGTSGLQANIAQQTAGTGSSVPQQVVDGAWANWSAEDAVMPWTLDDSTPLEWATVDMWVPVGERVQPAGEEATRVESVPEVVSGEPSREAASGEVGSREVGSREAASGSVDAPRGSVSFILAGLFGLLLMPFRTKSKEEEKAQLQAPALRDGSNS